MTPDPSGLEAFLSHLAEAFEAVGVPHAVVAKLRWAKEAEPGRQIEDAAGILRARAAEMDLVRVRQWVGTFGVTEQWARALAAAA